MNSKEIASKLLAVVRELDKVEVKGRQNMREMTACMDYLEHLAEELNTEPIEQEVDDNGSN